MEIYLAALLGYIIGSFPTAFILAKYFKDIDITSVGSKNVGALNSYESTGSKWIGATTLIIDMLKGILSVYTVKVLFTNDFLTAAAALVAAILGHCFSPWIKFKGGRGLAAAAGGSVILAPYNLGVWCLLWTLAFIIKKNVHFGNISATALSLALSIISSNTLSKKTYPPAEKPEYYAVFTILLFGIILIKHIEPFKIYIKNQLNEIKRENNEKHKIK